MKKVLQGTLVALALSCLFISGLIPYPASAGFNKVILLFAAGALEALIAIAVGLWERGE